MGAHGKQSPKTIAKKCIELVRDKRPKLRSAEIADLRTHEDAAPPGILIETPVAPEFDGAATATTEGFFHYFETCIGAGRLMLHLDLTTEKRPGRMSFTLSKRLLLYLHKAFRQEFTPQRPIFGPRQTNHEPPF